MTVLLLRLAGPMQSWGDSSRFNVRSTGWMPTKSGVIGLLAASQGRRRADPIEDLVNLRFGVREDQTGTVIRDFHTAQNAAGKTMPLSYRYYLADAVFLAGLEGPRPLLEALDAAVNEPHFPLYLGRRSCPVSGQLSLGLHEESLDDLLATYAWQASQWYQDKQPKAVHLEIAVDAPVGVHGEIARDVPISFDEEHRMYRWRSVVTSRVDMDNPGGTDHDDWIAALGGTFDVSH